MSWCSRVGGVVLTLLLVACGAENSEGSAPEQAPDPLPEVPELGPETAFWDAPPASHYWHQYDQPRTAHLVGGRLMITQGKVDWQGWISVDLQTGQELTPDLDASPFDVIAARSALLTVPDNNTIVRHPADGSPAQILYASPRSFRALAVADDFVYFTVCDGNEGTISRVPVQGGEPEVIVGGTLPCEVASGSPPALFPVSAGLVVRRNKQFGEWIFVPTGGAPQAVFGTESARMPWLSKLKSYEVQNDALFAKLGTYQTEDGPARLAMVPLTSGAPAQQWDYTDTGLWFTSLGSLASYDGGLLLPARIPKSRQAVLLHVRPPHPPRILFKMPSHTPEGAQLSELLVLSDGQQVLVGMRLGFTNARRFFRVPPDLLGASR